MLAQVLAHFGLPYTSVYLLLTGWAPGQASGQLPNPLQPGRLSLVVWYFWWFCFVIFVPAWLPFFSFPAFNCLPAMHPAPSLSFLLCTLSTSQQPFLLTTAESFGNSSYPGEEEQRYHTRACAGQQRECPAGKSCSQHH